MTNTQIPGKALSNDARAALKAFNDSKAIIAQAEAVKKEAEASLRAFLGDSTTGLIAGQRVLTIESRERKSNDIKTLAETFPEAYAATLRVTEYTFLKTL